MTRYLILALFLLLPASLFAQSDSRIESYKRLPRSTSPQAEPSGTETGETSDTDALSDSTSNHRLKSLLNELIDIRLKRQQSRIQSAMEREKRENLAWRAFTLPE